MVSLIDTHAHLYAEEFVEDEAQVLSNALKNGVNTILLPNIDEDTTDIMMQLAGKTGGPRMLPMLGLHPCHVKPNFEEQLASIFNANIKIKPCAVGEIGMDLYWDKSTEGIQKAAFVWQVEKAISLNLPIAIHSRDATKNVIDLLQPYKGMVTGVFHCFGDDLDTANDIKNLGFKIGIGGVLTFKNSGLDAVVKDIDMSEIILETDSPYLAPMPFRGKRNEPSYTLHIAQKLAEVKHISLDEVARITSENATKLFSL
jgi:TatD DNase family protein